MKMVAIKSNTLPINFIPKGDLSALADGEIHVFRLTDNDTVCRVLERLRAAEIFRIKLRYAGAKSLYMITIRRIESVRNDF